MLGLSGGQIVDSFSHGHKDVDGYGHGSGSHAEHQGPGQHASAGHHGNHHGNNHGIDGKQSEPGQQGQHDAVHGDHSQAAAATAEHGAEVSAHAVEGKGHDVGAAGTAEAKAAADSKRSGSGSHADEHSPLLGKGVTGSYDSTASGPPLESHVQADDRAAQSMGAAGHAAADTAAKSGDPKPELLEIVVPRSVPVQVPGSAKESDKTQTADGRSGPSPPVKEQKRLRSAAAAPTELARSAPVRSRVPHATAATERSALPGDGEFEADCAHERQPLLAKPVGSYSAAASAADGVVTASNGPLNLQALASEVHHRCASADAVAAAGSSKLADKPERLHSQPRTVRRSAAVCVAPGTRLPGGAGVAEASLAQSAPVRLLLLRPARVDAAAEGHSDELGDSKRQQAGSVRAELAVAGGARCHDKHSAAAVLADGGLKPASASSGAESQLPNVADSGSDKSASPAQLASASNRQPQSGDAQDAVDLRAQEQNLQLQTQFDAKSKVGAATLGSTAQPSDLSAARGGDFRALVLQLTGDGDKTPLHLSKAKAKSVGCGLSPHKE
jgi:hypothetical protein